MTEYLTPTGYGEAEYTEKRSRFIGRVWRTESEGEATALIAEMRERHWDATHNVYAYIIREGGIMRYSDDGEPHGTSGMPTLSVFKNEGISDFCCVITRYFGGQLLGAGGLVRAYSHTAKLALESAGISVMRLWQSLTVSLPYGLFERIKTEISHFEGIIESTDYGAEVTMKALFPETKTVDFRARLTDITAGAVTAEITGQELRAYP